nr:hypothetical protein [Tanacetum cinerariifolium]GEZ60744.1 hypothetical protein [Tanacetum cinerariifolium]
MRKHDHKELVKKLVADKLGREYGGVIVNGSVEVRDDEPIVENGFVVVENKNGHVGEITGAEVVKSIVQVVDANGIADVEMKTDDVESEELNGHFVLTADVVNTIISTPNLVSIDIEVIDDETKSASTLVDETRKAIQRFTSQSSN